MNGSPMATPPDSTPATPAGSIPVRDWVNRRIRVHPDTMESVRYWASRRDVSEQEYMIEAVEQRIARENKDYDLPTAEQQRLAQVVDRMAALESTVEKMLSVFNSTMGSLMSLMRGDNWLEDKNEDGEL